jgi:release factor glutamine methyltransferase
MRNGIVTVYDKEGNLVSGIPDMPEAYIQGWMEFYKLKFKVTSDVLIPRPETELLIDEVLKYSSLQKNMTVLDIGTGSGAIAISIAKNNPKIKIFASDISKEALKVAKLNASFHRVQDKIIFIESDLLSFVPEKKPLNKNLPAALIPKSNLNIDIIVTNLPYIPTSRIPYLDPSVKDFEPRIALNGGADGFEIYRRLFDQISIKNLNPKILIGEIDDTHQDIALKESKKYFPKANIEVKLDLAKKPRILIIKF